MNVRLATKSKILRRKQITIEKLTGNPVLFIGTEETTQIPKNLYKLDSQIIKIESHRVNDRFKVRKKKKRRRNHRNDRGSGILARSIDNISGQRGLAADQLSQLQIDVSNSLELCDIIQPEVLNRIENNSMALLTSGLEQEGVADLRPETQLFNSPTITVKTKAGHTKNHQIQQTTRRPKLF